MAVFFLTATICQGQINYEATYPTVPRLKYFNHISPKWVIYNSNSITLYNLNHSIFHQITVPTQPTQFVVYYLTEDLFDTDSTNLEYLISSVNSTTYYVKIYREDGTLLFSRDSAMVFQQAILSNYDINGWYNIIPTDSGVKLSVSIYNPPFNRAEIYSLPGIMPCIQLCNTGVPETPTIVTGEQSYPSENNSVLPYPNPSLNQVHIPVDLKREEMGEIIIYNMEGAEVSRYKVDNTFSDLVLSVADLSAGSYYYQLQTPHSKSEGKKLVIIK